MADTTLSITQANGDTETYTINRDAFEGVRTMTLDGDTITIDHTPYPNVRTITIDGVTVTIDRTKAIIAGSVLTYIASDGSSYFQPDGSSLYIQP